MIAARAWVAAIAALLLATGASASDEASDKRNFTCPVGGKPFTQDVGYSAFPLITFPDGSWLGDTEIGAQIPVCPDNGLVLLPLIMMDAPSDPDVLRYSEYTPTELAKLPALISDPEYRALTPDGPYAQAAWLAGKLGRPGEERFFLLQRATWATRDPALRHRLVERLVAEAPAAIDNSTAPEAVKRAHRAYVANGLRELGRFYEALTLLDRIEANGPPVPKPQDPDNILGPDYYLPPLRLAISEEDDGRFAAAMVPQRLLSNLCDGSLSNAYGPLTAATKASCQARAARAAKLSVDLDKAYEERRRWRAKPVELEKACATITATAQSEGLRMACEDTQQDRDQLAGLELAKQPETLAASCAATPEELRKGAVRYGCEDLERAVSNRLTDLIASDLEGFRIICAVHGDPDSAPRDRLPLATESCREAIQTRKAAEIARLRGDPVALDAQCKAYGDRYDNDALSRACRERQWEVRDQAVAILVGDRVQFDRTCGQYRSKMDRLWSPESDAETICNLAWQKRQRPQPQSTRATPSSGSTIPDIIARRMTETDANATLQAVAKRLAAMLLAKAKADNDYPRQATARDR